MIHEMLHVGRGIGGAKGHNQRGVQAPCGFECKYVFRCFRVLDIPIAIAEI